MTEQQITQLKARLAQLSNEYIDQQVASYYVEKSLEEEKIGDRTVAEYMALLKRVVKQLSEELESEHVGVLPATLGEQGGEYGSINMPDDLRYIEMTIGWMAPRHHNFEQHRNDLPVRLNKLIFYQITLGFWDRGQRSMFNPDALKLQELSSQLNTLQASLDAQIQRNEELNTALEEEKQKLTSFKQQKEKELVQITTNLQSSDNQRDQITQLLNSATKTNTEIDALKAASDKTARQIDTLQQEQATAKSKFDRQIQQDEAEFKKSISAILIPAREQEQKLEELKNKFEAYIAELDARNINQKISDLDELLGKEAAAQLFRTFDKRKNELKWPVIIWQVVSILVSLGVIFLGMLIFTNFFGKYPPIEDTNGWQSLAISSLKMIPAIILLYFVIRQYAKERAFQEEYAFRSAVALTVKAYADLITGTKGEEIKNQLIADAVKDVYRSPKPMNWEGGTLFSFRTRDLTDSVKSLTEVVKELKNPIK